MFFQLGFSKSFRSAVSLRNVNPSKALQLSPQISMLTLRQNRQDHPRVIVVGAGFGGLQAAQSLARSGAHVLLIDRNSYHTFTPLIYQVATAQLEPELIAYPIRTLLRRLPNTRFLRAEVKHVDFFRQVVKTDRASIPYDYLILATGTQTQFLGIPGAASYAFPLKTLTQAVTLRNHLLTCMEAATQESDPERRQQLLTVVIVGGGPTGVELAGALVELKQILPRDYPDVELRAMQIHLIQASDTLLADLPEDLGNYAAHKLGRLGVKVYLRTRVTRITSEGVELQGEGSLTAATVIWAAGLEAETPEISTLVPRTGRQKLIVLSTLQLQDYPNVYAIGDVAAPKTEKPLHGVAPEALQQGVAVGRNLRRQIKGKGPLPFRYFNKGRLAMIGCYSGVGQIGPFLLRGILPWLMWLGVHLVYLPGFRSRLVMLLSWLHGYGWHDRAVRLILFDGSTHAQITSIPQSSSSLQPLSKPINTG